MVKVTMQQNNETAEEYKFGSESTTPTPSSDVSSSTVSFTESETRTNISTGETLSVIFGKIKKFFTDLKAVAFSGSYNDLSDTPTIPTVNNATLTIKQGGTTKGTFTANASADVEIDLDAGGGSTYTAGDGISITNNVISVTNPVNKTSISFNASTIPCLFTNSTASDPDALLLADGTVATLADCLDLGESSLDLGSQLFRHWEDVSVSGNAKTYDYSTQIQTEEAYSDTADDGTYNVSTITTYSLFTECVQIVQASIMVGSSGYSLVQILLGKANGHLYAFLLNQLYQSISESDYISSCTLSADISFIKF